MSEVPVIRTADLLHEQLKFLGEHPLHVIAGWLGEYLGIGVDCITLTLLLSRVGGAMGNPINLAIYSDDPGADQMIADRIVNIVPENVARVSTFQQVHDLSRANFPETELLLTRNDHDSLFRVACDATCRDTQRCLPPSVWTISDERSTIAACGPTLVLLSNPPDRSRVGFGHCFARVGEESGMTACHQLRQLVLLLKNRRRYPCQFERKLYAFIGLSQMLVVNRLLAIIAALRIEYTHLRGTFTTRADEAISIDDYHITRELLQLLPTPGQHSNLSPAAADTAGNIFDAINDNGYQQTIPDNSGFGKKSFTTRIVTELTGFSYNTVKKHLKQLEDEGIIESLVVSSSKRNAICRGRGRQIYFRFVNNRSPPFGVSNPYDSLPTPDEIAGDCTTGLQT